MPVNPLLSIITVNLNNLEGLKKTMASVFDQKFKNFEYIIIDGGSKDGSGSYIESHQKNLNYWVSEPDKGIYSGMNKGIKASTGEYLLFLNSGDYLNNEKVLKIAAENLDGCDILYGNIMKVYKDGKVILDKGLNGKEITLKVFIEGTIYHCSAFINKKIFANYGYYDEKLKIVSDWKLFLIALGLNTSRVSYLDYTFSNFDMNGISNSNLKLQNQERNSVIDDVVALPIYKDYIKLREIENILNDTRLKNFIDTDSNKFSRKLHSIIFRIFLK